MVSVQISLEGHHMQYRDHSTKTCLQDSHWIAYSTSVGVQSAPSLARHVGFYIPVVLFSA